MARIGTSDLDVFPLGFGGNVFGWTADRDVSFELLDAFHAGGGNFIDTADAYSAWVPGNSGGESETILGEWLKARGQRDTIIATKVGKLPNLTGLRRSTIRAGAEASLKRLGVETIDLFYAHADDPEVPIDDIVSAFADLVDDGLIRYAAVSNFEPARLEEWIAVAGSGPARPVALQPKYNLIDRGIEADLVPIALKHDIGILPYSALASGFLTGKYRSTDAAGQESPRAGAAASLATPANLKKLEKLESVARVHGVSVATVALAWLREQPGVVAPLASASKADQIEGLLASATLVLSAEELAEISAA